MHSIMTQTESRSLHMAEESVILVPRRRDADDRGSPRRRGFKEGDGAEAEFQPGMSQGHSVRSAVALFIILMSVWLLNSGHYTPDDHRIRCCFVRAGGLVELADGDRRRGGDSGPPSAARPALRAVARQGDLQVQRGCGEESAVARSGRCQPEASSTQPRPSTRISGG